jgi:uncharacterized protein (TIGR02246 family)
VTPIEKLLEIEGIRELVARRVRSIDEKDWAGFAACYAPDAVSYSFQGSTGKEVRGAETIAASVAEVLTGRTTVHQIHPAEIRILSATTAEGVIPLEDWLWWEQDGRQTWMHGYGHYRQTFEKIDGRWMIKTHALTRLKVMTGTD